MNLRKTFTALAAATLTASVGLAGTAQIGRAHV